MSMTLTVWCSMCGGGERYSKPQPLEIGVDLTKDLKPLAVKKAIEKHGWIVQFNGDNTDTYCTKKCAE